MKIYKTKRSTRTGRLSYFKALFICKVNSKTLAEVFLSPSNAHNLLPPPHQRRGGAGLENTRKRRGLEGALGLRRAPHFLFARRPGTEAFCAAWPAAEARACGTRPVLGLFQVRTPWSVHPVGAERGAQLKAPVPCRVRWTTWPGLRGRSRSRPRARTLK